MAVPVGRVLRLLSVLLLTGGGLLSSQTNPPQWRWVDSRGSFCIWYLADPVAAAALLPPGVAARPVSSTAGVPEHLLRIVQDEPRFAEWIPGLVCVGRYAVVAANGVPVARTDDDGKAVLFTLTAMAALSDTGAEWQLVELGLDADRLDQIGEDLSIPSEDREFRVRRGLEGEDDQWSLRLGGAELIWSGRQIGDIRVGTTQMMSFGYAGDDGTSWRLDLHLSPASVQSQIGSLRVAGKGALAQALKSSPSRDVAGLGLGGEALMTFVPEAVSRR